VFLGPARNTGCVEVDDEDAHAAMAGGGVGRGQHEAEIGDRRIVDPELAAGRVANVVEIAEQRAPVM
jgi:hypothetical protein